MTGPIRTLVAADSSVDQKVLDGMVGDPGIEVVGVLEQPGDLALRAGLDAQVLLVAANGRADSALGFVSEAVRDRPDLAVVVASHSAVNGLLRQAFETGADDVVVLGDSAAPAADTFFALQKAIVRRNGGATGEEVGGELVCVLGPKGGTGKTLTAANLAAALADEGNRVVAVDLDLQFGDLGLALGMTPERTLYDLATSGGTLDESKLDAFLGDHESGLRVLMAPVRPEQASAVTPEFLRELFGVLRASFDHVVVDTPPGFTPEVIATIDSSSALCLVGMLDAPSLKNSRLALDTLDLMGFPQERISLLLNRADTHVGITHEDVASVLGRRPDVLVPSHRDIVRSINMGEPIVLSAKRSDAARAYRALAARYGSVAAAAPEARRGGRRGRLLGRL